MVAPVARNCTPAPSTKTLSPPTFCCCTVQGRRFSRPKRLGEYSKWVEQYTAAAVADGGGAAGAAGAPSVVAGSWMPRESADDRLLETVMLRLRLGDGLDLRQLAAQHVQGEEAADAVLAALQPHIDRGLVLASGGGGAVERVQLADPRGLVVSNDIISDVFAAFDLMNEDA